MDSQPRPHLADPRDVRIVSIAVGMESGWRQRCHIVISLPRGLLVPAQTILAFDQTADTHVAASAQLQSNTNASHLYRIGSRVKKTSGMWSMLGAWLCGWLVMHAAQADTTTVIDLAGRQVRIPARVERVLLGEGRLLPALAIVDGDDPASRLVGMMGDFEQLDPGSYAQWLARFPRLKDVPRIGRSQSGGFSDERALALRPQVAIFGLGGGHGPGERNRETLARLEAAGVAIVFVDFRHDPLANTPRSITLFGQVLRAPRRAAAYNTLWQQEFDIVRTRLATARPRDRPRQAYSSKAGSVYLVTAATR
ncbi:hypothetical protein [Burkholderia sp. ABCPW 11]|uniref:hypothetical protein n=1 Tax=Burkholderia sp. ABCPW 11 TaxID=1637859 RepID=UPI00211D5F80|nr:hypothetical protein [Burkholderia sp. ABCPW 11]